MDEIPYNLAYIRYVERNSGRPRRGFNSLYCLSETVPDQSSVITYNQFLTKRLHVSIVTASAVIIWRTARLNSTTRHYKLTFCRGVYSHYDKHCLIMKCPCKICLSWIISFLSHRAVLHTVFSQTFIRTTEKAALMIDQYASVILHKLRYSQPSFNTPRPVNQCIGIFKGRCFGAKL